MKMNLIRLRGLIAVIVITLSVIMIILANANAITLKNGECISVGNATYSIQYCAPPVCSANLTLGQNSTYLNQTDSCAINITTAPQDICTINAIIGLNSTYLSNSTACNVTIKTPEYSCPAVPLKPKCFTNRTLVAQENKTMLWEQVDDLCDLHVYTEAVPICPTFRVLQTHSLIENTALSNFGEMAGNYTELINKSIDWGIEKEIYKWKSFEQQKIIDSKCNMNDTDLYSGWKKISEYDRPPLHLFVAQSDSIDGPSFSQVLHPELVTEEIRKNYNFEAQRLLDVYFSAKFSRDTCETILYKGANYTSCRYVPLINQPCIDRAQYLEKLEKDSYSTGKTNAYIISVIGVILLFSSIIFYLHRRSQPPLR